MPCAAKGRAVLPVPAAGEGSAARPQLRSPCPKRERTPLGKPCLPRRFPGAAGPFFYPIDNCQGTSLHTSEPRLGSKQRQTDKRLQETQSLKRALSCPGWAGLSFPKRGFPVTHTADGANLANSKTEAGSSAKSWQRSSHSEKEKRKRMEEGGGRRGNRGKGTGWKNSGEERQQDGSAGRAAGKLCDGHRRAGWGTARGERGINMLKWTLIKM